MPPAPSAAVGLTRQGLARFSVGDFRTAEQAFRTVIEVAPHEAMSWNNLALVLVAVGELDQAVPVLRRSLGIDSTQLSPWVNLAGALVRLDRAEEAEAACAAALALDPASADVWQILAMTRLQAEDFPGAAEAFSRTIELSGESATLRLNLAAALLKSGRFAEAAYSAGRALALDLSCAAAFEIRQLCDFLSAAIAGDMTAARAIYSRALFASPPDADRIFRTALLYLDMADQRRAAIAVAEDWAATCPASVEAVHMRDAALSRVVARQPAELVSQAFDEIADDFDDRLVRRLAYQGPEQLAALIASRITADGVLDVLDLGCGTGLCAPFLRPYARQLSGIDLSAGMLAKAAQRGLYDHLEVADLLGVLGEAPARWDLLVAGDTFPYLGDLTGVFESAAAALKPGGWLAFSTEACDSAGYVLKGNGRFAHGAAYIVGLAAGRFEIVAQTSATLRREAASPVEGDFYLLRLLR
ncbi:MAG TPA: tetratricopeptide repeat protein [Phenylobacterium sp.]|jgi:predicted TPR repeat methyltransferase|nr:tetratricopeptide repeat protein [Phenylobacterium sp.]